MFTMAAKVGPLELAMKLTQNLSIVLKMYGGLNQIMFNSEYVGGINALAVKPLKGPAHETSRY